MRVGIIVILLALSACGSKKTIGDGDDGGDPLLDDGGPGSCNGNHCSSDLHTVVDCDGNVITTCPPDQGCSGTSCVPACQSANDNKSNIGCDYFVVDPDVILDGAGACFAAFVANTWGEIVTLSVEWNGQTLDPSKFAYVPNGTGTTLKYTPLASGKLAPNQVAILFLNRRPGIPSFLQLDCPPGITPAITAVDAATHGTGLGNAFHVSSSAPIVAYDIFPYGGGGSAMTSATLLLPTSAWDTNYVAVDAYGAGPVEQPFVQITGQQDGTKVTINPSNAIAGGTGVAAPQKMSRRRTR